MRRSTVMTLAVALALGAFSSPAVAAKKPKKKPPLTYSESGSIAVGYPGDFTAEANVTRAAFLQSCAVPPSQGTDGYVIALPEEMGAVTSDVSIRGGDATGAYDLDLFFFDDSCSPTGSINTDQVDELGTMPAGTRYVLVTAFLGVEITFDFEATEARAGR